MAAAKGGKYVVVHTAVDDWQQGEIIDPESKDPRRGRLLSYTQKSRDAAGEEQTYEVDKLERLLSVGAIRPATEEEVRAGRGFVTGAGGLSFAAQMKLAQLDAELDAFRRVVGDQKDKLQALSRLGVKGAAAPSEAEAEEASLAPLVEQRKTELDSLKKQAEENDKRLADLHQQSMKDADKAARDAEKHALAPGSAPAIKLPHSEHETKGKK